MGVITRSEATHRLKILASKINGAASAARDANWHDCVIDAQEAYDLLGVLIPHLEEAATLPVPDAWKSAPIVDTSAQRTGGMGYRGSSHAHDVLTHHSVPMDPMPPLSSAAPPPPIPVPKKKTASTAPPKPIKPIITPPPPKVFVTSPPPPPVPNIKVFDLSRISGQDAYFRAAKADPINVHADWDMTDAFDALPADLKMKVIRTFNETGKPVDLKDLEGK